MSALWWKQLRGIGCRLLSELRRRPKSILNRFLLKAPFSIAYFHLRLLLFLFLGLCLLLLLVSHDVDPVLFVLDLHIYSRRGPSMYVYCVVCYHVIASSPMCKKCWLCLCTPWHSCWWFRMPPGRWTGCTSQSGFPPPCLSQPRFLVSYYIIIHKTHTTVQ